MDNSNRREYPRRPTRKLRENELLIIRCNIDRMVRGDHWPISVLLQALIWNNLASSQSALNQARRDIGRDFFNAVADGRVAGVEPVPGTRGPVLWRRKF